MYMKGYQELENQDVAENAGRVSDALSVRLRSMDTMCHDWASWDATYQFVQDRNDDYIQANLVNETYSSADLNLIAVVDSSGQVVYQRAYDLANSKEIPVPSDFQEYLQTQNQNHSLVFNGRASGIILLSGVPMLTVSRPILTSHDEGPSVGTLIMGRFLDAGLITGLGQTTYLSLHMLPVNSPGLPSELIAAEKDFGISHGTYIQIVSNSLIAGYSIVNDLRGLPAFVFRIDMPRDIYAQGRKTLAYLQASLLLISVGFFFIFIFVVNKTILNRMTELSKSVGNIGAPGNLSKRVHVSGKDELSSLADDINGMIASIEKSDAEIRGQKEFIDRILAKIPNAVLVIDKAKNIRLTNAAFKSMFDLGDINLDGESMSRISALNDLTTEAAWYFAGQSAEFRTELQYKGDGLRKTLTVSMTRMQGEELFLIIFTDITMEMDRQDKLYLTDRLASVGEMASGIAHELNNPLSSILGLSELLADEGLPDSIKEDVVTINGEAKRAAVVVKNMLSFARKHASSKQAVQMNQVIDDVLKLRSYHWRTNNITVECNFDPALPNVMADYFQMQQVFLNIILNAEQSMEDAHGKGTLIISTARVGNTVKLTFTDDGQGIARQNLGRIFDPFFTTKEVGRGTGLGLSICYGIVTSHAGRIYAQSEVGKGATFIVELPVE
jgi:sensor domain CHASE-containing protein